MKKITVVGAGRVGETTARLLAEQELAEEVVLLDIREGVPEGTALDIWQCAQQSGFDCRVTGDQNPEVMSGSELVVVTAGFPRKPGMSRSDVLDANLGIIDSVVDNTLKYAPDSKLILVTNPIDVMTYRAWQRSGWDRSRVIGQAGVLDASRMATFIAMETGISIRDITTIVLGGHGDTMVPLPRFCTINGVPVEHFIGRERLDEIIERTRDGGAEILALRQTGSAYDAPAASVVTMVDAIVRNRKRLLPSVCILQGEYGLRDLAIGVPCLLGENGLEKVVELSLDNEEMASLETSAQAIREDLAKLVGK